MSNRKIMQQALEVLENSRSLEPVDVDWVKGKRKAVITALRAALAEEALQRLTSVSQEIEPVVDCPRCGHCCPQRKPLTDEQLRDALRQCPRDTVENLRVRWLYAKDFARAIEAAHGIKGEA